MRRLSARLRRFYGAHPLHLLTLLAGFALAGYAALFVTDDPLWPRMAVWFVAAVLAHDLVLFPLYALADRVGVTVLRHRKPAAAARVPVLNHVRVPVLASGLLLLLFFPGIVEQGSATFTAATGLTQDPYLARWLLLTAIFFVASAAIYAIRIVYVRRRDVKGHPTPGSHVRPSEAPHS